MQRIHPQTHTPSLPLHGSAASRTLEQAALAALPSHALMQRAAQAVAALARALCPHARTIWVACGPGNNGGDGLLAAAELHRLAAGHGATVLASWHGNEQRLPADARHALAQARAAGVRFVDEPPAAFDLGIDALLGLGARGIDTEPMAHWLARLQDTTAPVLCVDLPSGLDPDSGVWRNRCPARPRGPRHTLSLLTLKPGLFTASGRDAAGEIWLDRLGVDPAGAPPDAWLAGTATGGPAERRLRHALHKGSHGDLLVLGGQDVAVNGIGMSGAAFLAARAGLQAGAGRVYLGLLGAGPASPALDALWPELMFRDAQAAAGGELAASATTVCGCGGGIAVRAVLSALLERSPRLVLDADALNAVAAEPAWRRQLAQRLARGQQTILTPHPLEAARLLGCDSAAIQSDRLGAASRLARELQCVIVLKGSGSVVAAPGSTPTINPSGNALLATAGTGDVLAGMTGAYWSQAHGESAATPDAPLAVALRAAETAVHRHGLIADLWPAGRALRAGAMAEAVTPW
ncbi:MAG: hypothetical protein RJA36_3111 [Pseudomonadota bacterium]|jgi:hydroxyethylthiazole kinase-like uncharacterized protein yjeF